MQILVPTIPESAPFTAEQRAWLNGYLAGLFSRSPVAGSMPVPSASGTTAALLPLTILFGSQTGTAERLAKRAAKEAGKRGFATTVVDMAQTDLAKLSSEKHVLVITSTYGDGEPPDNAKALLAALKTESAPNLSGLRFSVCSLGDRNYARFCQCGIDFDSLLEKRGAVRLSARADCDLEYEASFAKWLDAALGAFGNGSAPAPATNTPTIEAAAEPEEKYTKTNPFSALLLTSRNLSGDGSGKEVRHVEFSLDGSDLAYEVGDALGVIPQNCPELVGEVLAVMGCDGEEAVPAPDGSTTSFRHALSMFYDLGKPSDDLLAAFSERQGGPGGTVVTVAPHHVIDLLLAYPEIKFTPSVFVGLLKKLQPRLYSISSSPKAHPGQVHLTVGAVRYETAHRTRKGVCSTFLADRVATGETRVGVYIHRNKAFRVPKDPNAPMIMVGPGTGIAPFRAFLEERQATGAKGKNWLFFGDQRSATDFLYREQLDEMVRQKTLTRLDTAFSRDQADKIYVQHRMLENASELYAWLEAGAYFYVCGDASRMAKDVDAALHRVVEIVGKKTPEQAAEYVDALRAAKRYQRDVY
ncbi:MAG: sulfite reductase subunit alpha [Nibricoccus sp.]